MSLAIFGQAQAGFSLGMMLSYIGAPVKTPPKEQPKNENKVISGPRDPKKVNWELPKRYEGKFIGTRNKKFTKKWIALTFDDGPNPTYTPKILDSLKKHNQRATFFVVGSMVKRYPNVVKRTFDEGHTLGNHTWSHAARPSKAQALNEILKTQEAVKKACGKYPTVFRPPYGITSGWNHKIALHRLMASANWTISSADTAVKDSHVIYKNVMFTPNPGDIVLLHDTSVHTQLGAERIIRDLTADGWTLVTLDELLREWDRVLTSQGL